jgi:hypothetical protein
VCGCTDHTKIVARDSPIAHLRYPPRPPDEHTGRTHRAYLMYMARVSCTVVVMPARNSSAPVAPSAPAQGPEPHVVRLSVNLSPEAAEALRELSKTNHLTVTDGVRRAISLWKVLDDAVRDGQRVEVVDPATERKRELLFSF